MFTCRAECGSLSVDGSIKPGVPRVSCFCFLSVCPSHVWDQLHVRGCGGRGEWRRDELGSQSRVRTERRKMDAYVACRVLLCGLVLVAGQLPGGGAAEEGGGDAGKTAAAARKKNRQACDSLGFTDGLVCSRCDALNTFFEGRADRDEEELSQLVEECRGCCSEEVASKASVKYTKAYLQVCD